MSPIGLNGGEKKIPFYLSSHHITIQGRLFYRLIEFAVVISISSTDFIFSFIKFIRFYYYLIHPMYVLYYTISTEQHGNHKTWNHRIVIIRFIVFFLLFTFFFSIMHESKYPHILKWRYVYMTWHHCFAYKLVLPHCKQMCMKERERDRKRKKSFVFMLIAS